MFVGHFGITLFLCAPLANILVSSGHRVEVPRWVGIALVITLLPDFDIFLPWFTHRGITHSLLAAVCLGVVVAAVVTAISRVRAPGPSENHVRQAILGFTVGAGTVVGHLVGDVITPMGIRPFYPVDSVYSLNLVYAKDVGANLAFVVIGIVVFWTVYRRSKDPVPTDGPTSTELAADSEVSSVSP
jgi:inner membrane protein